MRPPSRHTGAHRTNYKVKVQLTIANFAIDVFFFVFFDFNFFDLFSSFLPSFFLLSTSQPETYRKLIIREQLCLPIALQLSTSPLLFSFVLALNASEEKVDNNLLLNGKLIAPLLEHWRIDGGVEVD